MRNVETRDDPARDGWCRSLFLRRTDAWGPALVSAGFGLILHDAVTARTTVLLIAIAFLYWLGYAINDYCDAAFDARDERKARENFFVSRDVSVRVLGLTAAAVEAALLGVFAMFGIRGVVLFAVGNLAMWCYSARPVRLKSRPGLDLLVHGLFVLTFPYFMSLVLIRAAWTALDCVFLGLTFLASVAGQLRQQIRDFDVDSRTDLNFTTTFGMATSILWLRAATALTILIAAGVLVVGMVPAVVIPLGLLTVPALVDRVTARPDRRPPSRLYNLSSLAALGYSVLLVCSALFRRP